MNGEEKLYILDKVRRRSLLVRMMPLPWPLADPVYTSCEGPRTNRNPSHVVIWRLGASNVSETDACQTAVLAQPTPPLLYLRLAEKQPM